MYVRFMHLQKKQSEIQTTGNIKNSRWLETACTGKIFWDSNDLNQFIMLKNYNGKLFQSVALHFHALCDDGGRCCCWRWTSWNFIHIAQFPEHLKNIADCKCLRTATFVPKMWGRRKFIVGSIHAEIIPPLLHDYEHVNGTCVLLLFIYVVEENPQK